MKVLEKLKTSLANNQAKYSTGKIAKCWKYNLADVFDPLDD